MKLPKDYRPAPDLLKDKIILVTGAGDGIGKVAALTYAARGATVVLLGRTQSKLEQVYDDIEAQGGPQPAIYPFDLETATPNDYKDMHQVLEETFGVLHGVLHNAGQLGERTPISDYSPEAWMRVMQVNLNAPFLLTQALLPLLHKAERASIVFTSSGVANRGRAFWGAYAASKAGQDNLMQTLADELEDASAIRANSINPGGTRTAMRATAYPAEDPTTRPAPAEHMPLYLYLMGDDSVGVNGEQFDA